MNASFETLLAITCWSVAVACGVGLWFALWSDRARGRKRCPNCWYDMKGLAALRCPECGRLAPDERSLTRTRRRWRTAVLAAILMTSALGVLARQTVKARGWMGLVPTSIVIFLPYHEDSLIGASDDPVYLKGKGWITTSLRTRILADELWGWQHSIVAWRIERRLSSRKLWSPDGGNDTLLTKLDGAPATIAAGCSTAGEVIRAAENSAGIRIEFDETKLPPLQSLLASQVGVRPCVSALDLLDDTFGPVVVAAPWVQAQWYDVAGRVVIAERGRPDPARQDPRVWTRYDLSDLVVASLKDVPDDPTPAPTPSPMKLTFAGRQSIGGWNDPRRSQARDRVRNEILSLARHRPIRAEWIGDELFVLGDSSELCRARFAVERLRGKLKD